MTAGPSAHATVALLLTAPLRVGAAPRSAELLEPREYRRLVQFLAERDRDVTELLSPDPGDLVTECGAVVEPPRLQRLLDRGLLLSQFLEHWQQRALWVLSPEDAAYPRRLKDRLGETAPALLYGCGDQSLLEAGGLAVVGSRRVDQALVEYTEEIGQLAAESEVAVVSGGARGIDQAAMRGALNAGGRVVGVLSDSLGRAALRREHREVLREGRLTLISPYDPSVGFHVGFAMARNRLIYALSDVALVVSAEVGKGGTWAGAVEQLERMRFVPVYVRSAGEPSAGLVALSDKGARSWPNPVGREALDQLLAVAEGAAEAAPVQGEFLFPAPGEAADADRRGGSIVSEPAAEDDPEPGSAKDRPGTP